MPVERVCPSGKRPGARCRSSRPDAHGPTCKALHQSSYRLYDHAQVGVAGVISSSSRSQTTRRGGDERCAWQRFTAASADRGAAPESNPAANMARRTWWSSAASGFSEGFIGNVVRWRS
jgi:hypothetical protein